MAKKDFNLPKHGEIDTKNLYVSGFIYDIFKMYSDGAWL